MEVWKKDFNKPIELVGKLIRISGDRVYYETKPDKGGFYEIRSIHISEAKFKDRDAKDLLS